MTQTQAKDFDKNMQDKKMGRPDGSVPHVSVRNLRRNSQKETELTEQDRSVAESRIPCLLCGLRSLLFICLPMSALWSRYPSARMELASR